MVPMRTFCAMLLLTWKGQSIVVESFQGPLSSYHFSRLSSSLQQTHEDNANEESNSFAQGSFNPFNYNAAQRRASVSSNTGLGANNVVSLRKTRMAELTNELFAAVPDQSKINSILALQRDLLLEPLEDANAVQDSDSIYIGCKTRDERYRMFEQKMTERLATTKNPAVQQVVSSMKDFVLACERDKRNDDA